ncbi:MAG: hypothetical protein EAX96_07510 [Candidatus Lokiarchaeota archaeon]|nr:hypothetical protein [Candidatus Lokiarchaeota archaeon]
MSEEKDEMDGLLDSILDDIQKVDEKDKNSKDKEDSAVVKIIKPKPIVIKPTTINISRTPIAIQKPLTITIPKEEKTIQERVINQKQSASRPILKNIERLKLKSEAERLGISFEELLRRKGLDGKYEVPSEPKPPPIKKSEDRLIIKKVESKPEEKKIEIKTITKPLSKPAPVYRASVSIGSASEIKNVEETKERIKKIKFTEKLEEDTIGYKSPLDFKKTSPIPATYVSVMDKPEPILREKESISEEKAIKNDSKLESKPEEDKPYIPNVGGIPLFVDDSEDKEFNEELILDDQGLLSKAYGIKCPNCGHRFEQIDPERAECPKCNHVFWL